MTDSNYSNAKVEVDLDAVNDIADQAQNAAEEYQRATERQRAAQAQLQESEQVSNCLLYTSPSPRDS